MLRALHFSDLHVDLPPRQFPLGAMLNKRFVGGANLLLRRRRRFVDSPAKLAQLAAFARAQGVNALLCTGDYTVLGTPPEYRVAREAVGDLVALGLPYATVPGNHDLYLQDAVADGRFERFFGDLLPNDMPAYQAATGWPRVCLLGDGAAAICINSARPNPQVWRSSGRIADAELEALGQLLQDPQLQGRFLFLLTHYAPRREDGSPDTWSHGLENADALLALCRGRVHALLHGHIHRRFSLVADGVPVFGAGSVTDRGREGLWLFELGGAEGSAPGRAIPGRWNGATYELEFDAAVPLVHPGL